MRERGDPRARAPDSAPTGDGARGPTHPVLGRGVRSMRARDGRPPRRGHRARARSQRAVPALRLARLLGPPLEPGHEDVRARDHRSPQEVRREHLGRGVPPAAAVYRERGRRRPRQGLRLSASATASPRIVYTIRSYT